MKVYLRFFYFFLQNISEPSRTFSEKDLEILSPMLGSLFLGNPDINQEKVLGHIEECLGYKEIIVNINLDRY